MAQALASAPSSPNSAHLVSIGLVYSMGGKRDRSFNQSAYEGALRIKKNLGINVVELEPKSDKETDKALQEMIAQKVSLTVGIGFDNNARITAAAKANPNMYFGLIDDISPAQNVSSIAFGEEEGSYMVGYLAGINSSTGVIGFIGGMDIPLIHKFNAGFVAGAKAADKKIKVISSYIGTTPAAWDNPAQAKAIAARMKAQGADIIFGAAGGSGQGLVDYIKQTQCIKASDLPSGIKFRNDQYKSLQKSESYKKACAGNTRPLFFIGVDSNQNYMGDFDNNPATMNHALTSMVKRVDNALYALAHSIKHDSFIGGERRFGLREGGGNLRTG